MEREFEWAFRFDSDHGLSTNRNAYVLPQHLERCLIEFILFEIPREAFVISRLCGCGGLFHLEWPPVCLALGCWVPGCGGTEAITRRELASWDKGPRVQTKVPPAGIYLNKLTQPLARKEQDLGELSKTGRMSPDELRIHLRTLRREAVYVP